MGSQYLTHFRGDVPIPTPITEEAIEAIEAYQIEHFDVAVAIDIKSYLMYFNGEIADADECVERLLLEIAQHLPEGHDEVIVKAQGEDHKDRFDLILRENQLLVRRYEFVAQPEEPYIAKLDVGQGEK